MEAYRRWSNSKISKIKIFGYKVSEINFCSGFVPLIEIWKLRNSRLCLPALEIKEFIQEVGEEVVQDAEVDYGHQYWVMEEAASQIVIYEIQQSEDQQVEASFPQ